jgi:hypothetical protein
MAVNRAVESSCANGWRGVGIHVVVTALWCIGTMATNPAGLSRDRWLDADAPIDPLVRPLLVRYGAQETRRTQAHAMLRALGLLDDSHALFDRESNDITVRVAST